MTYSPGDGARSWFTLFADAGLETCVKVILVVIGAIWFGTPVIIALGVWVIVQAGETRHYRRLLEREMADLEKVLPEEDRIRREILRSWLK